MTDPEPARASTWRRLFTSDPPEQGLATSGAYAPPRGERVAAAPAIVGPAPPSPVSNRSMPPTPVPPRPAPTRPASGPSPRPLSSGARSTSGVANATPPSAPPAILVPHQAPALRAGIGLARTRIPIVTEAPPGTIPHFSTRPENVVVTHEVYRPWTFAITPQGVQGARVPRKADAAEASGSSSSEGSTPPASPS